MLSGETRSPEASFLHLSFPGSLHEPLLLHSARIMGKFCTCQQHGLRGGGGLVWFGFGLSRNKKDENVPFAAPALVTL